MTVKPFSVVIALMTAALTLAGCNMASKTGSPAAEAPALNSNGVQTVNGTLMDMNVADDWQTSQTKAQQQTQLEQAKRQIEARLKAKQNATPQN